MSCECVQKAKKNLIFNSYLSHISNDGTRLGFPWTQLIEAYFTLHRFIDYGKPLGWAPRSVQIFKKISLACLHLLMGHTQTAWLCHLPRVFLLRKEIELKMEIKISSCLHTLHFLMFTDSTLTLPFSDSTLTLPFTDSTLTLPWTANVTSPEGMENLVFRNKFV